MHFHRPLIKAALDSKRSLSEIAKVLEVAAADFCILEKLRDTFDDLPHGALSRKNQNSSLARRAFCLQVGRFLHEASGRWMDAEVAALVDIALPALEATTAEQVRQFRRPSTRARREIRRPKNKN
jgi:hypothetical protein